MAAGSDRPYLIDSKKLEELYQAYNSRNFVHPDPLEFLYGFPELRDREVVALVASSLAYGKVKQILRSISLVLERMNPSPFDFLMKTTRASLFSSFADFKHRFTSGKDLSWMLWGARCAIEKHGSLYQCFLSGYFPDQTTVIPALSNFVRELRSGPSACRDGFLPSPGKGSACKRLNLFLRWMVRHDDVDPGGWPVVPPSKLVVPLDTHMHRFGLTCNLTKRKQADMRTALEITDAFRKMMPEDPVRYDFVLTRFGIRADMGGACVSEKFVPFARSL